MPPISRSQSASDASIIDGLNTTEKDRESYAHLKIGELEPGQRLATRIYHRPAAGAPPVHVPVAKGQRPSP
jgi:hypothetical protein